jgi:NitT/TauT family transport system permease protein
MQQRTSKSKVIAGHAVFLVVFLRLWEWAAVNGYVNTGFIGKPSAIGGFLVQGFGVQGNLWVDLGYTLAAAFISFFVGSALAFLLGLIFMLFEPVERALEPYLTLLNAMPRIALTPLFLLWFGLGMGSKIAVGMSLVFFIVLSATVAGTRGVDADHISLSKALGATPTQLFLKVTLPSAVPVIFSGLRMGLIFSFLGVVGAELIAAERGLGQTLAYLQSTFNTNGVMAILFLLAFIGLGVTSLMNRIEKSLLAWR